MGSRDRLEVIADRSKPSETPDVPPCRQLLPLAYVIAELIGVARDSKSVRRHVARLLDALGDERHILTEATQEEIADAGTPQLARAIVAQRTSPPRQLPEKAALSHNDQFSLGL
jgi:PHP family Zn ribbon phosphoesterase